jgi:hypothetical protein
MNFELEWIWKEPVMTYINILFQHLRQVEENHERP